MSFAIYAKMTTPWRDGANQWHDEDKNFRAINGAGCRVTKLADACVFATKEDAEEFIESHSWRNGIKLEVRKLK